MTATPPSLAEIAAALQRAFPSLEDVAPLRLLGEGFRSLVVETPRQLIFRIGKNRAAVEGHALEATLLPALSGRVAAPIPNPEWYAPPSADLPFGAIGYRKLGGRPLGPERMARADEAALASQVAAFAHSLHRLSPHDLGGLALRGPATAPDALVEVQDVVLPALCAALTPAEYQLVRRWWEELLADRELQRYRLALIHGDLWYENMLVDDAGRRIVGVLDFEEARLGDPAQDLATQLHLGRPFAARVLRAYEQQGGAVDAGFRHRLARLWEYREFDGLCYAIAFDDPLEFQDAVAKLRAGPILRTRACAP